MWPFKDNSSYEVESRRFKQDSVKREPSYIIITEPRYYVEPLPVIYIRRTICYPRILTYIIN